MSFKSEISDVNEVTKQLKIVIPPEKYAEEFESVMGGLLKTTQVKGFRAGKAPRHMVEKMHGERVKYEVTNRLISNSLYGAIREHSIDMIGQPEIDLPAVVAGKEIEFTAQISVFPKPEIKGYDAFTVEIPKRDKKNTDVDEVLERLQTSKATSRKLEFRNTVQKGDIVDGSLKVVVEGEEETRPEPLVVAVGEGHLPKELEEGLIGLEIGQSREIAGVIPEDHREEKLRGKPATYTFSLNSLAEKVLPELNDDFAASLEMGAKTMLELRVNLAKRLEAESEKETQSEVQAAILDQILEKNPFQVPQALIDNEIRHLLVRGGFLNPERVNVEELNIEPFRDGLGEIAIKRVRSSIVVDRIGEAEKLTASEAEISAAFEETARNSNVSVEEVRRYFSTRERLMSFVLDVTREKVLKFLRDRTKVNFVEKKETAEESK